MMYNRIKIAKNLLTDRGFFICAIDHYELANLLLLCDDIFGENNRIANVVVVNKPEGRQFAKFLASSYENMLVYAKNRNLANLIKVALNEDVAATFDSSDRRGKYKWSFMRQEGWQ